MFKRRQSGDELALEYFWKIREVYNIKLFYHNLRVEMFYQEDLEKIKVLSKSIK